jgi:diguanylate cyclase (GGDEF)-like protein/PAS domain S-box-containing protein
MVPGWLKQVAVSLAAVLVLTFLYVKTQAVDTDRHIHILNSLREFKQVDTTLKEEVLKSRYGLVGHYDNIVTSTQRLDDLYADFRNGPLSTIVADGGGKIARILNDLGRQLHEREPLVERFKSQNSILRNSLHYFPIAADNLASTLTANSNKSLALLPVIDLLSDTLIYNINPTTDLADYIDADIKALRDFKGQYPNEIAHELDNVLTHAKVIIEHKSQVDPLVEDIISLPVAAKSNELNEAYNAAHEARVHETNIYRLYLYLFSVVLMGYIAYIMLQLRRSTQALQETVTSLEYQKFAMDQHSIVSIADVDGNITYANDKMCEISQFSRDELMGENHRIFKSGHHGEEFFRELWETISHGQVWHGEIKNQKKNGDYFWVESSIVPFMSTNGKPSQYVAIRTDITERKRAEEALFQEKERAQVTLQSIGDGVVTTNARGVVDYLNPMAEQLTGWLNEEARGLPIPAICHLVDEVSGNVIDNPVATSLSEQRIVSLPLHTLLLRRDGSEFAIELTAAPIRDRSGSVIGAVVILRDITEVRGLARKISYQATHDALTGLVNRHEFERRLEHLLKSAKENGTHHALCYMDLDQFKVVNDTCGHIAGDELLRQLSTLLQGKIRNKDTLARLGGDEFGVLLGECPMQQAQLIANMLCQTVNDFRFVWQDKTFEVGASIGLVGINTQSESVVDLLSAADAACYAAKDKGRNRVYIYTPDDTELRQRQGEMQWVSHINKAFDEQRFKLYCQRIMALSDKAGVRDHYEILLRMVDNKGRLILPMAFIPAAERYNIMPALDRWVIETVFSMYGTLHEEGEGATYAINVSGTSLGDENFLYFVKERLSKYVLPPESICFEITETAAIANMSKALQFMNELKELGCRFSLDDFGSGLSSFTYLKNLPVNFLKIDGSFVRDMIQDPIDYAMVESINNVGHVMGIETIAESVEDIHILSKLKDLKVDYAQGYGIERPRPLQKVDEVVKEL